jgi:hypothetical protein
MLRLLEAIHIHWLLPAVDARDIYPSTEPKPSCFEVHAQLHIRWAITSTLEERRIRPIGYYRRISHKPAREENGHAQRGGAGVDLEEARPLHLGHQVMTTTW